MNPADEIGKQSPIEKFDEMIELHGEVIKDVNKLSTLDYHTLRNTFLEWIANHVELFKDFTITDMKIAFNRAIRRGAITAGDDKDIEIRRSISDTLEEIKEKEAKAKVETMTCATCGNDKELEHFGNHRGGGKKTVCNQCIVKKRQETLKKNKKNEEEELERLREKNRELVEKLEAEEEKNRDVETVKKPTHGFKTEEEYFTEELGEGLYFISAILKQRPTNKLFHVTDQIEAKSTAEAIGLFTLQVTKEHAIISIGYEKAIHNTDTGSEGSK